MAYQRAYYEHAGKMYYGNTYEAVSMNHFHRGRTDVIRPLTFEAIKFANMNFDTDKEESRQAFYEAVKKQQTMAKQKKIGEGFERHFYALQQLALEQGEPSVRTRTLFL